MPTMDPAVEAPGPLPRTLNLRETIAWIAFADHTHPVEPRHDARQWEAVVKAGKASDNGRDLAMEWARERERSDHDVGAAISSLLEALQAGRLSDIGGARVIAGTAGGSVVSERLPLIPADELRLAESIPVEFLHDRGGWLWCDNGEGAFGKPALRFCDFHIPSADVRRIWPGRASKPASHQGALRDLLVAHLRKSAVPQMTNAQIDLLCIEHHLDVSQDGRRDAKKKASEATGVPWPSAGRPPGSKTRKSCRGNRRAI